MNTMSNQKPNLYSIYTKKLQKQPHLSYPLISHSMPPSCTVLLLYYYKVPNSCCQ